MVFKVKEGESSKENNYWVPTVQKVLYWNFTKLFHLLVTATQHKEVIHCIAHIYYLYVTYLKLYD